MLNCRRPHSWPPLTPEEYERAATDASQAIARLLRHVLEDDAYPCSTTVEALVRSIATGPLDVEALNRVTGWVLYELRFRQRSRALTAAEDVLLATAWRISDALHGPRGH